jgi:hypothetical protein
MASFKVLLPDVADRTSVPSSQRGRGGGGDAVLPGAGLGHEPRLAHALGQQRLAEHIVDLVRTGVVEVFALEQQSNAEVLGQP